MHLLVEYHKYNLSDKRGSFSLLQAPTKSQTVPLNCIPSVIRSEYSLCWLIGCILNRNPFPKVQSFWDQYIIYV